MSKESWNFKYTDFFSLGVLIFGAFIILLPLLVVFVTSFAPRSASVEILPNKLSLANYRNAWQQGNFLLAFANSTLVAVAVTAFQIVTSALAGYALARLKFRGKQALLLIILATLVIPFQLLVIPIFLVLKWGHLNKHLRSIDFAFGVYDASRIKNGATCFGRVSRGIYE